MSYLDYFCELLKNKFLQTGCIQEDEIIGFKLKDMTKNFYQEMSDKTKEEYKKRRKVYDYFKKRLRKTNPKATVKDCYQLALTLYAPVLKTKDN